MIKERQMEGIARAKTKVVYKGRKSNINVEKIKSLKDEGMGATAIAKDAGLTIWRGRPKRRNQRSPEPRAIRPGRHHLEMRLPEATPASSGQVCIDGCIDAEASWGRCAPC